jgi:demethylmenaquinone methyltransferase / 2-methoxy-6-polyprenyl-1,4-benzoquinol methylase
MTAPPSPTTPPAAAPRLDKSGRTIRDMFALVAPRYDFMNHLLSGALDFLWRRKLARSLTLADRRRVLDLCCGTGDQALELARRGSHVEAADFCLPMLTRARPKTARMDGGAAGPIRPGLLAADALRLPFAPESFSAVTVSFGLRNVADLGEAIRQISRILAPGGRLLVLEPAVPENPWLRRAYLWYFRHVLPRLSDWLSPSGSAYRYLIESVLDFPQRDELLALLEAEGLAATSYENLTAGIVCLYSARRPG